MVLDERTQKSIVSFSSGGGGKNEKVTVIGVLENNPGPTAYKEGMAMLSMVVSMVGMTWLGVALPCQL